jgi:hypothetical protein
MKVPFVVITPPLPQRKGKAKLFLPFLGGFVVTSHVNPLLRRQYLCLSSLRSDSVYSTNVATYQEKLLEIWKLIKKEGDTTGYLIQ